MQDTDSNSLLGGFVPQSVSSRTGQAKSIIFQQFRPENRILVRLTQIVLLYLCWRGLVATYPPNLMPTPVETLSTLYEMTFVDGTVIENVIISLRRVLIAFVITFIIGLTVGIPMGLSKIWEDLFLPYVVIIMMMPGILWATAILLTLGFGDTTAIAIAVFGPSALATIQIWKGTQNINQELLEMTKSFNVSRIRMIRRVILPNIAPELFAVARFGLGLAFKVMLIAELLATSDGMGARIYLTYSSYQYQEAWAWMLVIAALISVLELGLRRLEKRAFAYREDTGLEKLGA